MKPLSKHVQFYITFPSIPEPVIKVWQILTEYLNQHNALPKHFNFSQLRSVKRLRLTPEEVTENLVANKREDFLVHSGSYPKEVKFWLYHPRDLGKQSIFYSLNDTEAKNPDDWNQLIESIMSSFYATGAWQFINRYSGWQGANCIEKCYVELYGPLPIGFRTWKDPPSHPSFPELTLLDISLNPGRSKQLYPYSSFYPTAEMWLGPHFWQYAKCTKEEALAADFFIEKRETPHYLYLKCWPEAFTRPDGEQGRMQQRLWKLLFHEDCEWPPGSGNICDEPMYGPPELMPDYKPPIAPL